MNILNVDISKELREFEGKDKLDSLFELQKTLHKMFYNTEIKKINIQTKQGQEEFKKYLYCIAEEIFEAGNVCKSRQWVKTESEINELHVQEEICDALGFFVILCMSLNIDPKKLFVMFLKKWKVNEFRVRSNY